MDFKQLNDDDAKIAVALLKYLGLSEEDFPGEETQSWHDHQKAVEAAEANNQSTTSLTAKDKLKVVVMRIIDALYDGDLVIESASELVDTIRAVEWLQED